MNPYDWITISCDEPTAWQWQREAMEQKRRAEATRRQAEELVTWMKQYGGPTSRKIGIRVGDALRALWKD